MKFDRSDEPTEKLTYPFVNGPRAWKDIYVGASSDARWADIPVPEDDVLQSINRVKVLNHQRRLNRQRGGVL
jgi:hypothetical protein